MSYEFSNWADLAKVITAIIVIIQFSYLLVSNRRKLLQERKRATLDYLKDHLEHYREFNEWYKSLTDEELSQAVMAEDAKNGEKIRGHLSILERLAAGCRHGVYDLQVLAEIMGVPLRRQFNLLMPYIDKARNRENGSPRTWWEFENMCLQIDSLAPKKMIGERAVLKKSQKYRRRFNFFG